MKNNLPKLTIELIPKTCHFSNARTMVSKKDWDKIRFLSYAKANNKCEICGDNGLNQGYKHRVECHEVWEYDDINYIQKLVNLISLCVRCHQVKHFGRAIAIGKQLPCMIQLARVNGWTKPEILDHIAVSFELHKKRSKFQWVLDISILESEPYNIVLKETDKRIFEVKKYKKKKKAKPKTSKITGTKATPKAKIKAVAKKPLKNKKPPKL